MAQVDAGGCGGVCMECVSFHHPVVFGAFGCQCNNGGGGMAQRDPQGPCQGSLRFIQGR